MAFKDFVADLSNVISVADGHTVVCMSETGTDFTSSDIIGLFKTMSEIKDTKNVEETELFHKSRPIKKRGLTKLNSVTFTQLLTMEQYDKLYDAFDKDKLVYIGIFDADREFAKINCFEGYINDITQGLNNHQYGEISYVLDREETRLDATYTDTEDEG